MSERIHSGSLDRAIFACVAIVLVALLALLTSNLLFQYLNYRDGINLALSVGGSPDHASVLTYSRAWDFAVAKTSALFLSFLLVFTGALYVLRAAESRFELSAEGAGAKTHLVVSSPGLVMVTLGVFLVAFVVWNKSTIEYGTQPLAGSAQAVQKAQGRLEPAIPADRPPEAPTGDAKGKR